MTPRPAGAPSALPWRIAADGLVLHIRVTPRAGREALDGIEERPEGAVLRVKVRALPSEGAANEAVVALIATVLDVPRREVAIASGHSARIKQVRIAGDGAALAARLGRTVGISG